MAVEVIDNESGLSKVELRMTAKGDVQPAITVYAVDNTLEAIQAAKNIALTVFDSMREELQDMRFRVAG